VVLRDSSILAKKNSFVTNSEDILTINTVQHTFGNNIILLRNRKIAWRWEAKERIVLCIFVDGWHQLYVLTGPAAAIWSLCDGESSLSSIITSVTAHFKIKEEIVLSIIKKLYTEHLVFYESEVIENMDHREIYDFFHSGNRYSAEAGHIKKIGNLCKVDWRSNRPLEILLEPTLHCNRRCKHCYRGFESCDDLSFDTFRQIIDKIAEAGVLIIHIIGGEPFIRHDLLDILRYISDKGIRIHIDTNGTLLNDRVLKELQGIGIDILNVSLDGATEESYGYIRKKEDFATVIKNIGLAITYHIPVGICLCPHRHNWFDVYKILRFAQRQGVKVVYMEPYNPLGPGAQYKKELYLPLILRYFVKLQAKIFNLFEMTKTKACYPTRCNMGITTCAVHPQGDVSYCVATAVSLGNVLHSDLLGIWNSESLINLTVPRKLGLPCSNCFFPYLFNFFRKIKKCQADCRANVYTITKNIYAGNPHCFIGTLCHVVSCIKTLRFSKCVSRLASYLYERLPSGLSYFICIFSDLWLDVYRIKIKEKHTQQVANIIVIGRPPWMFYWTSFISSEILEKKRIEKISVFKLLFRVKYFRKSADLIIIRINNIFGNIFNKIGISIPEWVAFETKLPVSFSNISQIPKLSKHLRKDIRIVKKRKFHYEITHNIEDFDNFYNNMYVSYIQKKFGEFRFLHSYRYLKGLFKKGGILFIKRANERIGGVLYFAQKDIISFHTLGITDGNKEYVKEGAIIAIYYFFISWAQKNNFKKILFGASRSFFNDGLFRFKRKWGMEVRRKKDNYFSFRLYICNLKESVRQLLVNNPFIFDDNGSISAFIMVDIGRPVSLPMLQSIYRDYWTPGLKKVYVLSLSRVAQDIFLKSTDTDIENIDIRVLKDLIEPIDMKDFNGEESIRYFKRQFNIN